jgi:putative sigma-54 modulation protein
MRLELTGRHVDITPTLRRLVDLKLGKLERLLNDSAVSAQAVLSREKHRHRVEITLHARGEKFLHGVAHSDAWESSLMLAVGKITQQAQRVKGKWQERKRRGRRDASPSPESPGAADGARSPVERTRMPRIFRASRHAVKSMSIAEAAREIDAMPDGVVIFRDLGRDAISVLYRRQNGELTLVETEA